MAVVKPTEGHRTNTTVALLDAAGDRASLGINVVDREIIKSSRVVKFPRRNKTSVHSFQLASFGVEEFQ